MCLESQKPERYPSFTFLRSSGPPFLFLKSITKRDSKVGPSVEFVQKGKKHMIPVLSDLYHQCSSVPLFLWSSVPLFLWSSGPLVLWSSCPRLQPTVFIGERCSPSLTPPRIFRRSALALGKKINFYVIIPR